MLAVLAAGTFSCGHCAQAHTQVAQFPSALQFDRAELLTTSRDAQHVPALGAGEPLLLPAAIEYKATDDANMVQVVRVRFALAEAPSAGSYGVYLSRAAPGAELYVNGTYLGSGEDFGTKTWNYPLLAAFPGTLLRIGSNELLVAINRQRNPSTAVATIGRVWLGREELLYARYEGQLWMQVIGVEVVTLFLAVIGLFVGVLWLRRRTDQVFGLFSLGCAFWAIRNTQFFIADAHLTKSQFNIVVESALFWLVAVLFIMSFRILGRRFVRVERALLAYALLATVAECLLGDQATALADALLLPLCALFIAYLSYQVYRRRDVLTTLLWIAAIITSLTGAYDLVLMLRWVPWPAAFLMPYSAVFFAGTVGWALIDRFVVTHNRYQDLNAELEARLRQREQELAHHYGRLAQLEREHAISGERERIMRDMHDGLGLQLISSIRMVQNRELAPDEITALLTEAMDELRIAIDSIKSTGQDLLVMLGNLRYRLEPRLNAAGITLIWEVGTVSGLERLSTNQVADLTRIVQEAIANAIKHAHATELRLRIGSDDFGAIEVSLTDNGGGFATRQGAAGEGLLSMRSRAHRVGATLEIETRPGRTVVKVSIPLAAAQPISELQVAVAPLRSGASMSQKITTSS